MKLYFAVRPTVRSCVVKSEMDMLFGSLDKDYLVIEGDSVTIECEIKSRLPVKSIIWVKIRDGKVEKINATHDKYILGNKEKPNLTIKNVTSRDIGQYQCFIQNEIRLSNNTFDGCLKYLSGIQWINIFAEKIRNLPAFQEDKTKNVTLNVYGMCVHCICSVQD